MKWYLSMMCIEFLKNAFLTDLNVLDISLIKNFTSFLSLFGIFSKYSYKVFLSLEGRISMIECFDPLRREIWYLIFPLSPLNSSIQRTSDSLSLETLKQFKILNTVLEETLYLLAIDEIEYTSSNSTTIAKTCLLVIV